MTSVPAFTRRNARPPRPGVLGVFRHPRFLDRATFWTCVCIVLVYSQCWVMQVTGPVAAVDPNVSASLRNYFIPAYGLTVLLLLVQGGAVAMAIFRSPLLIVLLGVAFASSTWSIDPEVSGRRFMAVLLTSLSGIVIAVRFQTWREFVELLATAFAVLTVLSFANVLLQPRYGIMTTDFPGAWRGVWDHKNELGYNMSVGFTAFAAAAMLSSRRRWLWWGFALGAVVLDLASTSKTSLVCCLMAALIVGVLWVSRRGPVGALLAVYLALSGLCAVGFLVVADPGVLLAALGKDETLTGRTRIWAAVMHQIEKRPWTGFGYGAVWNETSNWGPLPWISKEQGFTIHEAHNGWLGIWLELGYIGLAAALAAVADAWIRTLIGVFRRPSTYFTLPFLAIFTLHSVTEAALLAQNDFIWLIFSAIAVKLASPEVADADVVVPARPRLVARSAKTTMTPRAPRTPS